MRCLCKKRDYNTDRSFKLIRAAGGKAVLAHPVCYQYEDNLSDEEILQLIKDMHADGIEANYIYIDRNNQKINDCDKWNKVADKYKLLATIGSDFHNKDRVHPEIGLLREDINPSEDSINRIINYL